MNIYSDAKPTYGIIYTDPPWPQTKSNYRKARPNQKKQLDYPTLTLPEIKEMHEQAFKWAEAKHNVFMWAIDKYLFEAEQMMKELGYQLHARMIWDKGNGIAPAFTVRFSHEYLLWFYKKGSMLMPTVETRGKYMTVIKENSTTHSTKPECVYEMLEDMFPEANKLELFARQRRAGWESFGNEI